MNEKLDYDSAAEALFQYIHVWHIGYKSEDSDLSCPSCMWLQSMTQVLLEDFAPCVHIKVTDEMSDEERQDQDRHLKAMTAEQAFQLAKTIVLDCLYSMAHQICQSVLGYEEDENDNSAAVERLNSEELHYFLPTCTIRFGHCATSDCLSLNAQATVTVENETVHLARLNRLLMYGCNRSLPQITAHCQYVVETGKPHILLSEKGNESEDVMIQRLVNHLMTFGAINSKQLCDRIQVYFSAVNIRNDKLYTTVSVGSPFDCEGYKPKVQQHVWHKRCMDVCERAVAIAYNAFSE